MTDKSMTIERVMRYLFSQEYFYWDRPNRYSYHRDKEDSELFRWYHCGFELLSQIRKGSK